MKKLTSYLLTLLLAVVVVTSGTGCAFLLPYALYSEEETEEEYDYYDDYEDEIETTKKPIQKPVLETTEETTESTTKIPVTIMPNGDIFIGQIEEPETTTAARVIWSRQRGVASSSYTVVYTGVVPCIPKIATSKA